MVIEDKFFYSSPAHDKGNFYNQSFFIMRAQRDSFGRKK